jgi:hypothetical protein
VFELISVGKSSLHPLMSFFAEELSLISSSNIMKRFLYLMDCKCCENIHSESKPPRGCAHFRLDTLSVMRLLLDASDSLPLCHQLEKEM